MTTDRYSELLVDTDWLAARAGDLALVIVDCDTPEAYQRAHVPGAVSLNHPMLPEPKRYLKDPDNPTFILPPDKFAQVMASLGIGESTLVITYDGSRSLYAARMWWCLNYYGHTGVKVLDGGWRKWLAEGRPISDVEQKPQASSGFTAKANPAVIAGAEAIMARIGRPDVALLDVRSDGEWTGENTRGNQRSGHMPGAVHLEWTNYVDERGSFKPPEELRRMLEEQGITPDREVIPYCQGGIRAAHALFTLNLLGYERVRNYDGSFRDWGNRYDTPIVKEA